MHQSDEVSITQWISAHVTNFSALPVSETVMFESPTAPICRLFTRENNMKVYVKIDQDQNKKL